MQVTANTKEDESIKDKLLEELKIVLMQDKKLKGATVEIDLRNKTTNKIETYSIQIER